MENNANKDLISIDDKKELLKLARNTIAYELDLSELDDSIALSDEAKDLVLGAFVTIHLNENLRGCIGYIIGETDLYETIAELAFSAAFSDPRFKPLSKEQYDGIDIEISLLSPIVPVDSIDDIELGRDGLIVSTESNRGLLLPQVAVEQNWKLNEFLEHTCMKAGLSPNAYKEEKITIEKFSAEVFSENDFK